MNVDSKELNRCTEEKEQHPKTIGEIRKKRLEIESEIMEEAKQELIIAFEKKRYCNGYSHRSIVKKFLVIMKRKIKIKKQRRIIMDTRTWNIFNFGYHSINRSYPVCNLDGYRY